MAKIINWRNLFEERILDRGQDIFDGNGVDEYEESERGLRAYVGLESEYDVYISHKDGKITSMYCDCPYAKHGYNCKHMAALLLANEYFEEQEKEETVSLFGDEFDVHPYYFDLKKIMADDYTIYKSAYEKALELMENKEYSDVSFELRFNYDDEQILVLQFIIGNGGNNSLVRFAISRDRVISLNCGNWACYGRYESYSWRTEALCEHEILAILLMKEYILAYDPGDYTDVNGMEFLNSFIQPLFKESDEETLRKEVKLRPRLEKVGGILQVSFRAGIDKLYIIKNLQDLLAAYEEKAEYKLGKKNQIDFRFSDFDDDSKQYADFILREIHENNTEPHYRYHYYEYAQARQIDQTMTLFGRRLDDFFDISKGKTIDILSSGRRSRSEEEILTDEKPLKIRLELNEVRKDGEFVALKVQGKVPDYYEGLDYFYQLTSSSLIRLQIDNKDLLHQLPRNGKGDIDYTIGLKQLPLFYNHILPLLSENFAVVEKNKEDYEDFLPLIGTFNFYFDVRDGIISCLSEVTYGEQTFNLLKNDLSQKRDTFAESRIAAALNEAMVRNNELYLYETGNDDESIEKVLTMTIPQLQKLGDVHSTAAFDRLRFPVRSRINVGVRMESNLLELDIQSDDIPLDELAEVINSYKLKRKFHKLRNGQLLYTDDANIAELSAMMDTLDIPLKELVKGKMNVPAYRALYLNSLSEANEEIYDKRDTHFKQLIADFEQIDESSYAVPSSLEEIMRPYQADGFRWLKTLSHFGFGGILADEMGLGKTLQSIALLKDFKDEKGSLNALIICPSSLVYNWKSEVERFAPDLDAITITGDARTREKLLGEYAKHDILITSYDLLRRDINHYSELSFDFQILDEAQYIKTATTANARSCKIIKADQRFALTGTPIENNLAELWSIFDFLMKGFLYRYEDFASKFENPIVNHKDEEASKRLRTMIAPFILRRKKADVLKDLPEKMEETITVMMDDKQRQLYDSQVLKMSRTISDSSEQSFSQNKIAILAELMKIRQICLEPSLVFEDYNGESAKREACIELIENAIDEGHKILLFSQFTSMLEVLEKQLKERDIAYYKITGQTKKEQRLKLVNSFNKDKTPLFLISLKAGGTGLNLTGADIVIHYDPWWNVAAQNQATDRAHRIGQQKIVTVYQIIAKDSIEERIVELQNRKSELVESMLSGDNVSLSKMSKQDLLDILN